MRHSSKILRWLFAFSLALVVTGCSSNKTVEEPPAGTPEETPAQTPAQTPSDTGEAVSLSLKGLGNTPSNLLQDGIAAKYDGYIYHVDKMMAGSIWRMPVGGGVGELLATGSFRDLNVMDGVIFATGSYKDPANGAYIDGIVRMNTDGSGLQVVKEGYFEKLAQYDDYLYFSDTSDGGLYRIKYDGSDEKLLVAGFYDNFTIIDGVLYVCAQLDEEYELNVYKMPPDASAKPELIIEDIFGGGINAAGDCLYFLPRNNTSDTCRYDTKTGEISVYSGFWLDYVNTDGEALYYYRSGLRQDKADYGLYRNNFDGSNEEMLMQAEELYELNIAGGKLFWHSNDAQRRLTVGNLDAGETSFVEQAQE